MIVQQNQPTEAPTGVLTVGIRTAVGEGQTMLSAFDAALLEAGVANFNLIRLSSVIPRQAVLTRTREPMPGHHGDRLYCVYATAIAEHPGETVWAGIGWVRDESGRGLFVEHSAGSEESLRELIDLSLSDLSRNRGGGYGPVETAVASAHHVHKPVCALAIATYQVDGWRLQ